MSEVEQIRNEALNLSVAQRKWLIHELVDSLSMERDAKIEAAWDEEIARRIREVEEGKVECISHEEAMARAAAACK